MNATARQKLAKQLANYVNKQTSKQDKLGYVLILHDFSDDANERAQAANESQTSIRSNFALDSIPKALDQTLGELSAKEMGIGNVDEGQVGKDPWPEGTTAEQKNAARSQPIDDVMAQLFDDDDADEDEGPRAG